MHITHKIRKFFRAESVSSVREHASRLFHPVDAKPMRRAIDAAEMAALRDRYLGPGAERDVGNAAKFVDVDYWLKVNVERAQDLRLNAGGPLKILDLGCGAGYFLHVCGRLGHEAVGIDIDENPLFRETIALLDVRRVVHRIEAFVPLPDVGGSFDLVTAHCICFQKLPSLVDGERHEWGAEAWRFFLDDVRTNQLKPQGRLLLDFNPRGGGVYFPPEVGAIFRKAGARFSRSKVWL